MVIVHCFFKDEFQIVGKYFLRSIVILPVKCDIKTELILKIVLDIKHRVSFIFHLLFELTELGVILQVSS